MSDFRAAPSQLVRCRNAGETFGEALLKLCRSELFGRSAIKKPNARTAANHGDDVEDDQRDGECAWHNI